MSPFSKKASFDSSKCVSLLETILKRLEYLKKKKLTIARQSRDDVSQLLRRGQDANAVARVELVFRDQNIVGAYEILEQHCHLVIKGIKSIRPEKECSSELKEAIASLIYASPRCGDLQELQKVRDLFASRYGSDYITAILELRPECHVNTQIVQKFSSNPPNSDTRLNLLKEIALEYKIDWNYQRAVAVSFKSGDASEKPKVSPSVSLVSKTVVVDDEQPTSSDKAKAKEPAASLAAQTPSPVEASAGKYEFAKERQSSDVSRHGIDKLRNKAQASSAAQNSTSSTAHDITPRERDATGAEKTSYTDSPPIVDKSVHAVRSKENASVPAHRYTPAAMDRAQHRKKEFVDAKQPSAAGKEKPSPFYSHQDNELKGHPNPGIINASSPNSLARHRDRFASPSHDLDVGTLPTPAAMDTAQHRKKDTVDAKQPSAVGKEKPSAFYSHQDNELKGHPNPGIINASPPNPLAHSRDRFASPSQDLDVGTLRTVTPASVFVGHDSERANMGLHSAHDKKTSLSKAKASPIELSDARVSRSPGDIAGHKQQAASPPALYQAKVFSSKPEPHFHADYQTKGSEESLAAKHHVRAHQSYAKVEREKREGVRGKHLPQGDSSQKQGATVSSPIGGDVESIAVEHYKDYKHVQQQAVGHESPPKAVGEDEASTFFKDHASGQLKGTRYPDIYGRSKERELEDRTAARFQAKHEHTMLSEHEKHVRRPNTRPKPSVLSELRSKTVEVDQELADLENVIAAAARAADAAIDIVRISSIKSRSDRKGTQQRDRNSASRKSYGGVDPETGFGPSQTSDGSSIHRRDSVVGDRLHSYGKPKGDLDHAQSYQQEQEPVSHCDEFSSEDESLVEEPPFYKKTRSPFRKDDDPRTEISSRRRIFRDDRIFETKLANDHVDKGVLRWQGAAARPTAAGDLGKKKWPLGNVHPPVHVQTHMHEESMNTESNGGGYHGVSWRSARS